MISRKVTKKVRIGNILIGGSNKIAIQSMCNTKTKDTSSTIEQIKSLEKEGCNIVRVAVLDINDALAIKTIKENINIPLVADIHFDYKLALASIESGIDKLRINPGNIGSIDKIKLVVDKCKEKNIPIRIGVNMGSLDKEIEKEYGRCAKALVESAKKHVQILESLDFYNTVISLKASDVQTTIEVGGNYSKAVDNIQAKLKGIDEGKYELPEYDEVKFLTNDTDLAKLDPEAYAELADDVEAVAPTIGKEAAESLAVDSYQKYKKVNPSL